MRVSKMIGCRFFLLNMLFLVGCAKAVTYQDLINHKSVFTVTTHGVVLADVERPATRCADSDPYVCIKSNSFSLAIPKRPLSKWAFEGSRYEVISKKEQGIFGKAYDYDVIKVSGALNFYLLYSKKDGVIAIREPSGNMLLPNEKCGILVQDVSGGCD